MGIHIDETLSWKYHIDKVCSKISSSNYINKVKNILPSTILKTLYSSSIQSHINYGLLVWGSSYTINKVYELQKRAIRTINNKSIHYHTEPLFKTSNILTVSDQYKLNVQICMHQLKNSKTPQSFSELKSIYFTEERPSTRQQQLATCCRFRTTFTLLLPLHRFPRLWNELHHNLRNIISITIFKRKVSAQQIDLYYMYAQQIRCANRRCRQCFPVIT